MTYRYTVICVRGAPVSETWVVESPHPLGVGELTLAVSGSSLPGVEARQWQMDQLPQSIQSIRIAAYQKVE